MSKRSNSKGKGHYGTGKYITEWKRYPNPMDRLACLVLENKSDIDPETASAIYGMIGQLPPNEREVIQLRVLELLSFRAIGAQKGWYQTSVKYLEAQAIQKLREWVAISLPELGTP